MSQRQNVVGKAENIHSLAFFKKFAKPCFMGCQQAWKLFEDSFFIHLYRHWT